MSYERRRGFGGAARHHTQTFGTSLQQALTMKGMALIFQILELKVQGMGFESVTRWRRPPSRQETITVPANVQPSSRLRLTSGRP